MRYYVVSDVHGFYTPLISSLEKSGFFQEKEPCKLIVCGDLLDRGLEAKKMQDFATELLKENKLIFIRGNHEDLFCDLVSFLEMDAGEIIRDIPSHHVHNGTWDTMLQLSAMNHFDAFVNTKRLLARIKNTSFWKKLLPFAMNYYETEKYIFVHGYIPYRLPLEAYDWRGATDEEWGRARWHNGMEIACERKVVLQDKKIVCGHYHTSYGHYKIDKRGSEFGRDAIFSPFYSEGIIALDGCTAFSGRVNCVVLEDN
ncbi:MAG: hypothetical protein E7614_08645 [Ruminococcaceae bacterium]|nr:hypothetical protein [Oscillospiraceae bacterium]